MPCYNPITGYVTMNKTESGKKEITFTKPLIFKEQIDIPCGQCIGCRLLKASIWAIRCYHEMSLHEENCFITLTYDDENLPNDYSVDKKVFQNFLKKFRREIYPKKISYFMAGEYGEQSWRPHYHAIIFGFDFPDKIRVQSKEVDNPYYISGFLSSLWPYGNHIIADANYETAAYVARYITKKITGTKAEAHYHRTILDWNEYTGEIYHWEEIQLEPEYCLMSRRPAIGKGWFEKYFKDCYPSDYLVVNGRKIPVPKYYDKLFEKMDSYNYLCQKNYRRIKKIMDDNKVDLKRLSQIEGVKHNKLKSLSRSKI